MSLWLTGLLFCLALFPQEPTSKPLRDPAAEARAQQLLKTLPPGSLLRRALEEGERGDGIRQPWMNDMQREGVKAMLARVEFDWDQSPKSCSIVRTEYLGEYAFGDEAADPMDNRSQRVRVSVALDQKLQEVVRLKAIGHLPEIMKEVKWRRARGTVTVVLFDDQWLPSGAYDITDIDELTDPDVPELTGVVSKCRVARENSFIQPPLEMARDGYEQSYRRAEGGVRRLLEAGADVNAKDQDGWTALAVAVGECRLPIIQMLLRAGAKVNFRSNDGETPLMRAVGFNKLDIVEVLLAAGADVNARDNEGRTALAGNIELVKADTVQRLLAAGADVNARDVNGWTPLMLAAFKGLSIVPMLLGGGADVNAADKEGRTALMLAADSGKVEAVQALLAAHANVNARSKNGQTALSTALRRANMNPALNERFLKIAELLRQGGAKE